MMSTLRRSAIGVAVAGCGLLAYWAYGSFGASPSGSATLVQTPPTAREMAERSAQTTPERAKKAQSAPHAPAPPVEDDLMQSLRESFVRAPLETLELARQAESDAPDSPDGPERSWLIVRCLVSLGRFHEAREEAKKLVARSPDSHWTIDVQRHLLVNPLDYPSREELQELAKVEAHP